MRGEMRFALEVAPRFDYGRARHEAERHPHGVLFRSLGCALALETGLDLELREGDVHASSRWVRGRH